MSSTTYLDTLILDKVFFGANFELSTSWYAALFSLDPGKAGQLGFEVNAAEYARQPVTLSASYSNTTEIVFPTATSAWGAISHIGLVTAATGGYLGVYGAITGGSISVVSQDIVKIPAGGITVTPV